MPRFLLRLRGKPTGSAKTLDHYVLLQTDSHEKARKCLRQVFSVRWKQSQALFTHLPVPSLQEIPRKTENLVKVDYLKRRLKLSFRTPLNESQVPPLSSFDFVQVLLPSFRRCPLPLSFLNRCPSGLMFFTRVYRARDHISHLLLFEITGLSHHDNAIHLGCDGRLQSRRIVVGILGRLQIGNRVENQDRAGLNYVALHQGFRR